MAKRKAVVVAPRNTRAEARKLFPSWPRSMQAKWAVAKLRTRSGTWCFPIGGKATGTIPAPEFLHVLPRDSAPLVVEASTRDKVRASVRYLKGLTK